MPMCLLLRDWGGISWNMTNISFVLGLVGLSLNYVTWDSKCYIQHLVMPTFKVTFLKCTERPIFFIPRIVLPFDAHDFLLNLICNVSFCLLFYWFSLFLLQIDPGGAFSFITYVWNVLKYLLARVLLPSCSSIFLSCKWEGLSSTSTHHKQSEAQPMPSWEPGYRTQALRDQSSFLPLSYHDLAFTRTSALENVAFFLISILLTL